MTDLKSIFLTSGITIIGGYLIFVVGQITLRFVIEPIHELRKTRGEIGNALIYYSDLFISLPALLSGEIVVRRAKVQEASEVLRHNATLLFVRAEAIPWYGAFYRLGVIPSKNNISKACDTLLRLSNLVADENFYETVGCVEKVVNALGLPRRIYQMSLR